MDVRVRDHVVPLEGLTVVAPFPGSWAAVSYDPECTAETGGERMRGEDGAVAWKGWPCRQLTASKCKL